MVNTNIITEDMYHKVRGIIRGEISHLYCTDCKKHDEMGDYCNCNMMFSPMNFRPKEEYLNRVARKICDTIGEPLNEWDYEEWE